MLLPMERAACVTMPVAASVLTKRRCKSGVIELRRGAAWMKGAKASSGSSSSGSGAICATAEVAWRAILREISDEESADIASFAHLLVNGTHADKNRRFFEMFAANPLMQFRLWDFRERFSKPKLYQASLKSHMTRVGWQIERIYRSRNELVHAGQKSRYLDSLGRNAESYFQMVVNPLAERGRVGANLDVDGLFAEFHIEFDAFVRKLANLEGEPSFPQEEVEFFFI